MAGYKKAGLILMIKKRLRLRAKRPKLPLMAQACLKRIDKHNIVKSLAQRLIAKRFYSSIKALILFQTSKSFK